MISTVPRRRRIAAVAIVASLMYGLLGVRPEAASAVTVGVVNIVGHMGVGNGIAYPCLDGKTSPPAVNPSKCGGYLTSGNTAAITLTTTVAAGVLGNGPDKGVKSHSPELGTFSFVSTGSVTGACGLAKATLTGGLSPVLAIGGKSKFRSVALSMLILGNTVFISGMTNKGERIDGTLLALPEVGTCENKTPKTYTIIGSLFIHRVP